MDCQGDTENVALVSDLDFGIPVCCSAFHTPEQPHSQRGKLIMYTNCRVALALKVHSDDQSCNVPELFGGLAAWQYYCNSPYIDMPTQSKFGIAENTDD